MVKGFKGGAAALLVVGCLSSCAQLKQALSIEPARGDTLEEVDTLLGRIEHVYVECERAELRVMESTTRLHKLVGADFDADATETFVVFQEAVTASAEQGRLLRKSVEALEKSADAFFKHWESDLEDFKSTHMRKRSQDRMVETRDRYKAIISAVGPALPMYDSYNEALSDHALYLQNDFNASAVMEIEGEVRTVTDVAKTLTGHFKTCRSASREYVERAALRGQLETPADDADENTSAKGR